LSLQIKNLHYFVTQRELAVETETGIYLFFDLNKDIEPQIEKLVIFNKEDGDISKKNIIYIDNRVSNKIFYCDTESEYKCRKNLKEIYGNFKDTLPQQEQTSQEAKPS